MEMAISRVMPSETVAWMAKFPLARPEISETKLLISARKALFFSSVSATSNLFPL